MTRRFAGGWQAVLFAVLLSFAVAARGGLAPSAVLLPVSDGELTVGEWNSNFSGALAVADACNVPLLVFFGGLSCGRCEELQSSCLTDEFIAWQRSHRMLMVYTTNNSRGDASGFAKPEESTGYPFIAVYWNRNGSAPAKGSDHYRAFNGREGEMLVKGGSLAAQLIGSIETVAGEYDFSSVPDISARADVLYADPVTSKLAYEIDIFTGLDAAAAFVPQTVYNLKGTGKPVLKKVSGQLPAGVKLICENGAVSLKGSAKKAGVYSYSFSIQQKRNGILHVGPAIALSFRVAAANDASQGGCAMLGKALKASVPLVSPDGDVAGVLEIAATARNKVRAKYAGVSRAKATFSGAWTGIEAGTAIAALVSGSRTLSLELAGDGRFKAMLSDPASFSVLESPDGLNVGFGSHASAFAGTYTASMAEAVGSGSGSGYVCVKKVTPAGKVAWSGVLGNGVKVSGNAFAMRCDDGGFVFPAFKVKAKDYLSAVLKIASDGQATIVSCEGTKAAWGHVAAPAARHECTVRGARYFASASVDVLTGAEMALSAEADGFVSGRFGNVQTVPSAAVTAIGGKLALAAKSPDVKMTFSKNTGEFKGSMKVAFASGNATVKFSGVLVADGAHPFALGTAWFSDAIGGSAVKRGFDVKMDGGAK